MTNELVLSVFPGIDLLGRGFEEAGYCIVRGPDKLWGGDVRLFHPPHGRFDGVIGGSPCQDFSKARRGIPPTGQGLELLGEFIRVVDEAGPRWFLLENVPGVPDVKVQGYTVQRLDIRASDFGLPQTRLRHFQFGSSDGCVLVIDRPAKGKRLNGRTTICATDNQTPWADFCVAMGLPPDYDLPFTVTEARRAVGNGVPLPVGRAMAEAVKTAVPSGSVRLCVCNCGRPINSNQTHAGGRCRQTMLIRRRKEGGAI